MSNLQNIQRRIANGTTSWLNFEFNCNRGDLFSEKSLTIPVGQIMNSIYENEKSRVKAEEDLEFLVRKNSGRGRRPALDFAVKEDKKWIAVAESKWIGDTLITFDQVLWDLIRLEMMIHQTGCTAFFVLSGFHKKMKFAVGNTHFYSGKTLKPVITSKRKQHIKLDLTNLDAEIKEAINRKLSKYNHPGVPRIMNFKIPHFSPDASHSKTNMSFETVVWEVLSDQKVTRVQEL